VGGKKRFKRFGRKKKKRNRTESGWEKNAFERVARRRSCLLCGKTDAVTPEHNVTKEKNPKTGKKGTGKGSPRKERRKTHGFQKPEAQTGTALKKRNPKKGEEEDETEQRRQGRKPRPPYHLEAKKAQGHSILCTPGKKGFKKKDGSRKLLNIFRGRGSNPGFFNVGETRTIREKPPQGVANGKGGSSNKILKSLCASDGKGWERTSSESSSSRGQKGRSVSKQCRRKQRTETSGRKRERRKAVS